MSTPSKKRRHAREWMRQERERSNREADRRAQDARMMTDRDWRSRLSRIIPPDDGDTFYPQGRLERPYLQVLAPSREAMALRFDPTDARNMYMREVFADVVPIVAKQMAMVLPNGAKVVWWTWEMGR